MKSTNKTILIIIIIALISNIVAYNILAKTSSISKVSANDVSVDSIINDVNNNAKEIKKIESGTLDIEFLITPTSVNTIEGKCKLNTFVEDAKTHLSTKLTKNGVSTEKNIYLDENDLLFTLDNLDYYDYDLSKLTSFSPKLNSVQNFIMNINNANYRSETSSAPQSDISSNPDNQQVPANSDFFSTIDFQSLLQIFLNISNSLTLEGTKTIDQHEMYALKASINNDTINSLMNYSSCFADIPTDISSKLKSVDNVDVELYISSSGENLVGFYVNLSNIVSTLFDIESPDNNYIQLLFGLNTSENFQVPEGNELGIIDTISIISDISKSIDEDTDDYSDDYSDYFNNSEYSDYSNQSLKGLDIGSIFDGSILDGSSSLFDKFDAKKIVLKVINDYVFGSRKTLLPTDLE